MHVAARYAIRHPWQAVLSLAALAVGLSAWQHQPRSATGMRTLFEEGDANLAAYDKFRKAFDDSDMIAIALTRSDVFTKASLEQIRSLSTALAALDGVRAVNSLTTVNLPFVIADAVEFKNLVPEDELDDTAIQAIKAKVARSPSLTGRLISQDGHTTVVAAEVKRSLNEAERSQLLEKVSAELTNIDGQETQVHVTSNDHLETEIRRLLTSDHALFAPVAQLSALLLLWLTLQSFSLALAGTAFAAAVAAIGVSLMTAWTPQFNAVTTSVPLIMFALPITACIPVLRRYRDHAVGFGGTPGALVLAVVQAATPTIWLSQLISALGFAVAILSPMSNLRCLGTAGLLAVVLSLAATLTVFPAFLYLSAWRRRITVEDLSDASAETSILQRPVLSTATHLITAAGVKHRYLVLSLAAVMVAAGAYSATRLRIEMNPAMALPANDSVRENISFFDEHLSGALQVDLTVTASKDGPDLAKLPMLQRLDRAQTAVLQDFPADFTNTLSIVDYYKEMQRSFSTDPLSEGAMPTKASEVSDYTELMELSDGKAMGKLLSPDKHLARISISRHLGSPLPFSAWQTYLRTTLTEHLGPGISAEESGSAGLASHLIKVVRKQLPLTLALTLAIIVIMLALWSRSAVIVAAALCSMLVAVAIMLIVGALSGRQLDISCLGLGVIAATAIGGVTAPLLAPYSRLRPMEGRTSQLHLEGAGAADTLLMALVSAASYWSILVGTLESTKTLGLMAGAAVLAAGVAGLLVFPAVLGRLAPEV